MRGSVGNFIAARRVYWQKIVYEKEINLKRTHCRAFCAGLFITVLAAACAPGTTIPLVPSATSSLQPATTQAATAEPEPISTSRPTPTSLPTSAPTVSVTASPTTASPAYIPYLDDRSGAAAVLESLFNAINLHQIVRAYSYWDDTPERLRFDQFQAGYQETASVQVVFGPIGSRVRARAAFMLQCP